MRTGGAIQCPLHCPKIFPTDIQGLLGEPFLLQQIGLHLERAVQSDERYDPMIHKVSHGHKGIRCGAITGYQIPNVPLRQHGKSCARHCACVHAAQSQECSEKRLPGSSDGAQGLYRDTSSLQGWTTLHIGPCSKGHRSAECILAYSTALWWPMARPVVRRPNTRKGCALAWYLTSFWIGSGMKYLIWKNTCTKKQLTSAGMEESAHGG